MMLDPEDDTDTSPGPVAAPAWASAPLADPAVDTGSAPAWKAAPEDKIPVETVRAHIYQLLSAKNPDPAAIHQFITHAGYGDTPDVDLAVNWLKDHQGRASEIPIGVKDGSALTLGNTAPPTAPELLWQGTKDTAAGIGEGLTAIPDLAAQGLGKALSIIPTAIGSGLDALGYTGAGATAHGIAHDLAYPTTGSDIIEHVAGPATSTTGRVERGAAALVAGGMFGDPSGIMDAGVTKLAGGPMPNVLAQVRPAGSGQVYQAAQRLGVENDLLPADVAGAGTGKTTAIVAAGLGGKAIANQATRGVNALAAVKNATADAAGSVADSVGAGQAAQSGAKSFIQSSENRASQLYDAIPIAADKPAVLENTKQALSNLNAGLQSNPELSRLISDPRLQAFEDAIAGKSNQVPTGILDANGNPVMRAVQSGGQLSWQDLKAFRTFIGEKAGQPALQSDTSQKALKALYGSLSDDMATTAAQDGSGATQAFNRANTYWRGRQDRIDNVISAVLGNDLNKGSQSAFDAVQRMSQARGGDPIKLGRLLRSLPSDEASTVRATVIDKLGMARAGAQDASGTVFSPAEFATQWNKLDPRAKASLFNDGDTRAALNDLATVSSAMKAGAKYANRSGTANAANGLALLSAAWHYPLYTAGAAAAQLTAGKILSSPALTRALAGVGRARTPAAARLAIARVSAVGAADVNLKPATDAMVRAMNDNVSLGSVAASNNPGQNQQQ